MVGTVVFLMSDARIGPSVLILRGREPGCNSKWEIPAESDAVQENSGAGNFSNFSDVPAVSVGRVVRELSVARPTD